MASELDLYPDIQEWLRRYLQERFKRSSIDVFDTHAQYLKKVIIENGYTDAFPEHICWEMKTDITAFISYPRRKNIDLVFIEVKDRPISLQSVGQLLGYSIIAQPLLSFLISPQWISKDLSTLIQTYERTDVLRYGKDLIIRIMEWDVKRKTVKSNRIIPKGKFVLPEA